MREQNGRVYELDPSRVKPFADQPRKRFRGIAKLAESIKAVGQVTPVIVTACDEPAWYAKLVDGERRLQACLRAGLKVRAVFDHEKSENRYVRSIAANFCRQDHDAVEIMEAVLRLKAAGWTRKNIATIFGKTATWVAQYQSLHRLAPEVLEKLKVAGDEQKQSRTALKARGRMTISVALLLAPLPVEQQVNAAKKIQTARMSISQARTFVRRFAAGKGVQIGKHQSGYSRFKSIRTAVETCSHVVDRYLEMPGVEIGPMIRNASREEKRELAAILSKLCEDLLMLSDAMK